MKRLFGQDDSSKDIEQNTTAPTDNAKVLASSTPTKVKTLVAADDIAPDIVDGLNALAAYYRFVEAQAYDGAMKSMRSRRDFREVFLDRSDMLLAFANDDFAAEQIQAEIDKEAAAFRVPDQLRQVADLAAQARALDSDGYRLLGLTPPLTWDSLKSAYRAAAKIHHPDVGGDTSTMRRANDAYGLFSALLRRKAAEDDATGEQPQVGPMTTDMLFAQVRLGKLFALVDDLAADSAFDTYRSLDTDDIERAYGGASVAAKLAELLAASDRPKDAATVLHDLGRIAESAAKRHLNYGPIFRKASEACCDPKRIRFIPNHMRQANNMLRLGIIDKKRYDALDKRIGGTETQLADDSAAFEKFVHSRQFLTLPMDVSPSVKTKTDLVPAPGYYSRVESLTGAQQYEYFVAYHGGASHLAQKYLPVRLDALMRAPFRGYADIGAVLGELRAIESAPGLTDSMRALCKEAITVIAFLSALSERERKHRIDLLNRFDCDPRSQTLSISISFDSRTGLLLPQGPASRPIFINPQFSSFATAVDS
jgi:hypothetical protein